MFNINETTYAVYSTAKNDEARGFVYLDLGDIRYSDLPKKSSVCATKADAQDLIVRRVANLKGKLAKLQHKLRAAGRDKDYRSNLQQDIRWIKRDLKTSAVWKVVKLTVRIA